VKLDIKILTVFFLIVIFACNCERSQEADPQEIYERAINLIENNRLEEAKPVLEQVVKLSEKNHRTTLLIDALLQLASLHHKLGEFDSALTVISNAEKLMHEDGDIKGMLKIHMLEADVYYDVQAYNLSTNKYRLVSTSALAFGEKKLSTEAFLKLGDILRINNHLNEALDAYKSAYQQAQALGDHKYIISSLLGLSTTYRLIKQYSEAYNSLSQALSLADSFSNAVLRARLKIELGLIYFEQQNVNAALKEFGEAVNTLRIARTDRRYEIVSLFYIGYLYERSKRFLDAKKYYNEALDISNKMADRISSLYISIFLARINSISSSSKNAELERHIAEKYLELANEFHAIGHIAGEGFLYVQLGKYYENNGDLLKAREYCLKATKLDEDSYVDHFDNEFYKPFQDVLGITSSHYEWYESTENILLKLLRYEEALTIAEYYRLREMARKMWDCNISLINTGIIEKEVNDLREKIMKLKLAEMEYIMCKKRSMEASRNVEVEKLLQKVEILKKEISEKSSRIITEYPNYETLVNPAKISISDIQKFIPKNSLLLEYFPADSCLYILALSNSDLKARSVRIIKDTLYRNVEEYQKLLQEPAVYSGEAGEASLNAMTRFAILSTKLYDIFFRPIDDLFKQNIIIVPSKKLVGFPFHALEKQFGKEDVKYLIEMVGVDYVPTMASLRYKVKRLSNVKEVVAFGNPSGKNWSVDYELRDIRSFYSKAQIMLGLDANWSNLKSVEADVLQISTDFLDSDPECPLGKLMLSNGKVLEQVELISYEKLLELKPKPVIILSNQIRNRGDLHAERAMLLHINGTADVFLNTWVADRKVSKFFSEFFFTNLSKGLAPGDAYRQALLELIRMQEVNQPHSWAQFIHFGIG